MPYKNPEDRKAYNKRWREKNKGYGKKWFEDHPEKVRHYRKDWYAKNKDKKIAYEREKRAALCDSYIRGILKKRTTLTREDISPELIELNRLQIQLKREMKNESDRKQS